MAIRIKFDSSNNPLPARLILATKGGSRIRELPIHDVKFQEGLVNGSEFTFSVAKARCTGADGLPDEEFWKAITDFRLAYCPEFDEWYELHVDITESSEEFKAIEAVSLGEAELSQIGIYGMEVNTDADINRTDYVPTVLYNTQNTHASLLDRLLDKAPHYRIAHVDDSIRDIQRTFQFHDKTILDCLQEVSKEMDILFVMKCGAGETKNIDRTISVYDLENHCESCGYRGDFITECPKCESSAVARGYGEDTSVFVSRDNLAQEINFTTDTDSVKNCFRLEAGDDLMTATVINCNPNGSQYIWYFTDEMKEDMSPSLRDALTAYDAGYREIQSSHEYHFDDTILYHYKDVDVTREVLRNRFNALVTKYNNYGKDFTLIPETIVGYPALMTAYYDAIDMKQFLESELMPSVEVSSTDAATEAAKLTNISLSPVAVANIETCSKDSASNAVVAMAKCIIRGTYSVDVKSAEYTSTTVGETTVGVWSGVLTVTNYGNEEDTASTPESGINKLNITVTGDYERFLKQKIKRAVSKDKDDVTDIAGLFELGQQAFETELQKYSLNRLLAFRESCDAALSILIQQGVADEQSWVAEQNNLYDNLYTPYLNKAAAIDSAIAARSVEIETADAAYMKDGGIKRAGMLYILTKERNVIQNMLDFYRYIGNDYEEFASFRREDTYSNSNYISDGLGNAELFTRAQQFLEVAEKDLVRSATRQHSIQANLSDLLTMNEFHPIVNRFKTGNWIRIRVGKDVYRLRISEYTIDYNSMDLGITFTDVRYGADSASDIENLLSGMRSMSTSYGSVARQAEQGKKSYSRLSNWVAEGFRLTTKIVGGAENQEFVMDDNGFTGREYLPEEDDYSPEQIKIISHGVYVTNDGWRTAKAGLGHFRYWDPRDGQIKDGFGVIAETIVGSILLGQEVGIYNEDNSVVIDKDGLTLVAEESTSGNDPQKIFKIQKKVSDGQGGTTLQNILWIDSNGSLQLNGFSNTAAMNSAISSGAQTEIGLAINSQNGLIKTYVGQQLQGYVNGTDLTTTLQSYSTTEQTAQAITSVVGTVAEGQTVMSTLSQTADGVVSSVNKTISILGLMKKNLAPYPFYNKATIKAGDLDITYNSDGSFGVKGDLSADRSSATIFSNTVTLNPGKYIFSLSVVNGTNNAKLINFSGRYGYRTATSGQFSGVDLDSYTVIDGKYIRYAILDASNASVLQVCFSCKPKAGFYDITIYPQIELAGSNNLPTTWEMPGNANDHVMASTMDSKIEQTADSITSTVSKTFEAIGLSGKNLVNYPIYSSNSIAIGNTNIVYTDYGSFIVRGYRTVAASTTQEISTVVTLGPGRYVVSFASDTSNATDLTNFGCRCKYRFNESGNYTDLGTPTTTTLDDKTINYFTINAQNAETVEIILGCRPTPGGASRYDFNDVMIYPQIELGTSPTSWEPAGTHSQMISRITQKAGTIDFTVSKKVGEDEIIAKINASVEQSGGSAVLIQASKINLDGVVTMTGANSSKSLNSALADNSTTIDGGRITTGSILATRISGGTLTLGGNNNGNGVLSVKNANNVAVITLNNNGFRFDGQNVYNINGLSSSMSDPSSPKGRYTRRVNIDEEGIYFITRRHINEDGSQNSTPVNMSIGQFNSSPRAVVFSSNTDYGLLLQTANSAIAMKHPDYGSRPIYFAGDTHSGGTTNCMTVQLRDVNGGDGYTDDGPYSYFRIYAEGNTNTRLTVLQRHGSSNGKSWYFNGDGSFETEALNVNGLKSRVVDTEDYATRKLYCYETPTPMFGDLGDAVIDETGTAYIFIESIFAETVETSVEYQVFLQKYGQGECYVSERTPGYFIVQGTPGLRFGWELKAKQRDYDQLRLDKKEDPFTPDTYDYGVDAADYIQELEEGRIPE